MEYFDDAIKIICPDCRGLVRVELSIGYQPVFWLHDRNSSDLLRRRKKCRLCLFRHPVSKEVIVRVVPSHLLFGDYLPVVVAELRAVAGKAGLL